MNASGMHPAFDQQPAAVRALSVSAAVRRTGGAPRLTTSPGAQELQGKSRCTHKYSYTGLLLCSGGYFQCFASISKAGTNG